MFFNLKDFKLFIISWKNFFKRIFQEIINIEGDIQKYEGYKIIIKIIVSQLRLNHVEVEGSKMENKLFII